MEEELMGMFVPLIGIAMISQMIGGGVEPTPPDVPVPPLPPSGKANLYGKVQNVQTGGPIAGVQVTLDGVTTETDEYGDYLFTDQEPATYSLQFSKEGYETVAADYTLYEGNNRLDVLMAPVAEPDFYWLRPTGHIANGWNSPELAYDGWTDTRAEVVNVGTQSWSPYLEFSIAPTEVSAVRWWGSSPVSPKKVQVIAYYGGGWHLIYEGGATKKWDGGLPIPDGAQVISGARIRFYNPARTVRMKFRVNEFQFYGYAEEPPPEPEPPPTTRLYGHVTDKATGAPIAGASGTVYQDYNTHTKSYSFTTDSQGYYEVVDMLHEYDLTKMVIYANGYVSHTDEDVSISEGANLLNVQMTKSAQVAALNIDSIMNLMLVMVVMVMMMKMIVPRITE